MLKLSHGEVGFPTEQTYQVVSSLLARSVATGKPAPVLETVHQRLTAARIHSAEAIAICDSIIAEVEARSAFYRDTMTAIAEVL